METQVQNQQQAWPGIGSASQYILPSYQWMLARYEAADSRIQTLLTFVTTVTFAVPTLCRALRPELSLQSPWFIKAIILALITMTVGLVARLSGGLVLLAPMKLYKQWLGLAADEFQKDALYFAGEHFEANRLAVNRKANAEAIMVVCFAIELALFFLWVLNG